MIREGPVRALCSCSGRAAGATGPGSGPAFYFRAPPALWPPEPKLEEEPEEGTAWAGQMKQDPVSCGPVPGSACGQLETPVPSSEGPRKNWGGGIGGEGGLPGNDTLPSHHKPRLCVSMIPVETVRDLRTRIRVFTWFPKDTGPVPCNCWQ